MRLVHTTAAALAAAAVLIAVPATADASTTNNSVARPASACATVGDFAKVAPGQTLAQVQAEMGSPGNPSGGPNTQGGFSRYEPTWTKCSGLPVFHYGVVFYSTPGQPLTESSKTALAL